MSDVAGFIYTTLVSYVKVPVQGKPCSVRVVWHTGKVLACGAVGPRFKYRQTQGIFVGPILFCIRMAHYSGGKVGWFSARTLSFHQCN